MRINMGNRLLSAVFAFVALAYLQGCAPGMKVIASEELPQKNPMANISILAESQVVWPRMGGKEPVLGLQISKTAMARILPETKKVLENKGYSVSFAEPVGIGYANPKRKENNVYKDYEKEGDTSLFQTQNGDPAFVYDVFIDKPEVATAAKNLFEAMEKSVGVGPVSRIEANADDLKLVQSVTGGDTLCLTRIGGARFSSGRVAGALLLSVLLGGGGVPQDSWSMHIACLNPNDGDVLWQHGRFTLGDPISPNLGHVSRTLEYFPKARQPLTKGCVKEKETTYQFTCSEVVESTPQTQAKAEAL